MSISDKTRYRLEMQGYTGLSDKQLSEAAPWLKFAPAICAICTAISTYLDSYTLIWSLASLALLGAILPHHPFDVLYNFVIRHFLGQKLLPKSNAPRRFTCAVGTVWLLFTGYAFYSGADIAANILGYSMVAVATLSSTTDFCIPSWLYGKMLSPFKKVGIEI